MKGIAYGVGVGPGDPELMTVKAIRLIQENRVIALPGKDPKRSAAYQIAVQSVPDLAEKKLVPIEMPMVRDRAVLKNAHRKGAQIIADYLDRGENVIYLTLGDPTVYSTFSNLQHILEAEGYPVELVSGVPSFCAAAARLKLPLAEGEEPVYVLPAACHTDQRYPETGTCVLVKPGRNMQAVKELLRKSGREASAVENCGMKDEKIYRRLEELPDQAGYFTLIIAKKTLCSDGDGL